MENPDELQHSAEYLEIRRELDSMRTDLGVAYASIREHRRYCVTLKKTIEDVQRTALTDFLTGLWNRRHFDVCIAMASARAVRERYPLSIVMIDVDYFKMFNDTYGHVAGDDVLRTLALLLRGASDRMDTVTRFGGEEFAVIRPSSDAHQSIEFAERLRTSLEGWRWPLRTITASFGVSTWTPDQSNDASLLPPRLIDQADAALYCSKRRGRNRVTHHEQLSRSLDQAQASFGPFHVPKLARISQSTFSER